MSLPKFYALPLSPPALLAAMADEPAQPRASRLRVPVKRPAKRHVRSTSQTMHYSTPEERAPSSSATSFRDPSPSTTRPTIEQIAMGLHVSRTPHLRHSTRSSSQSRPPITPSASFKNSKNSTSSTAVSESSSRLPSIAASASSSASTSTIASASASLHLVPPSTPKPVTSPSSSTILAIKQHMARFLPGEKRRSVSAPQLVTPADGGQKKIVAPQKAVRFELLSN